MFDNKSAEIEQTQIMFIYLNRVEVIRCNLEEFDRELADQIKPLALFYEGFDVDGKGTME